MLIFGDRWAGGRVCCPQKLLSARSFCIATAAVWTLSEQFYLMALICLCWRVLTWWITMRRSRWTQTWAEHGKDVCGFQQVVNRWPSSSPRSRAALQPFSVKCFSDSPSEKFSNLTAKKQKRRRFCTAHFFLTTQAMFGRSRPLLFWK